MKTSENRTVMVAADVSVLAEPALYAAAYAMVSPDRRKAADSCRLEKDKWQTLGAEWLLRYALREWGYAGFPDTMKRTEYGKPYLQDESVHFNWSHSADWAVCALSGREVGCDVEKIRPVDLKTARRFHPEEYEDIVSQKNELMRQERFFRYWTLKESFMKATGQGLQLPLNAFRIRLGEEPSVRQSFDDRIYCFREYDDIPGYGCALCAAGSMGKAEMKILDLRELLGREIQE